MAIIKTFETPQGISATYHRIVKAEIEVNHNAVVLQTAVYLSAEARDLGKSPVWNEYTTIPFDAMDGDFRKSFYELLTNYYGSYLKNGASDDPDPVPIAVVTDPEAYNSPEEE